MKSLTGSEKQIAWAEEIRKEFFRLYDIGGTEMSKVSEKRALRVIECREELETIDNSKWYIDHFAQILKEKRDTTKAVLIGFYYSNKSDKTKNEVMIQNIFGKVQNAVLNNL